MIEIGTKAPEFKLFDTDRKERSLNEFTGKKVVLAFFPELSPEFAQRRCVPSAIHWQI